MLVLGLPGNASLAPPLAAALGCAHAELELHRFPDGEALVRLPVPVRGECVVLAASLDGPDAKTLPLVFAADAARELGARAVGLVAPYLAYMRQDMRFKPGEAVTSRSYARLLSGSLDFLATVDPHLHRWETLGRIYPIPTEAVPAAPAIAGWLRDNIPDALLVGPDAESAQWVSALAQAAGLPALVLRKVRHGDRDVQVALPPGPLPRGRTPVLVDDIASTGHTLAQAARALQGAGLPCGCCIAVHALFAEDALQVLAGAGIGRVLSCDTIAHPTNAITIVPGLAAAVRRLAPA